MEYAYQNSTIAQILEAIINESTFEGESNSNIGDILLSILNKTPYTEPPKSVIADLLLRVKAKIEGESYDPYDDAYTSRIAEILISILEETEYTEAPQSRIAELLLELKEELEAYTELTASGSVASFITNVVKPLVNGEFTIAAYQEGSGDPSPVNVRNFVPFNAVNIFQRGTNQWDEEWFVGGLGADGEIKTFETSRRTTSFISVAPNTRYREVSPNNAFGGRIAYYDKNQTILSYDGTGVSGTTKTFTTPDNCHYVRITIGYQYGTTYNNDISINYPSTDTAYHAYNGETVTVALGQGVYVGVYNSVTGKFTSNYQLKPVDKDSVNLAGVGDVFYVNDFFEIIDDTQSVRSNILKRATNQRTTQDAKDNLNDFEFCSTTGAGAYYRLFIKDSTHSTLNSFRSWLVDNPIYILVRLSEPIEIQLDPTLIETYDGSNNIFCDTGDTSVTYLYKGTPPTTLNRMMSKGGGENNDIIKEEIETEDEIEKPINEEVNENEK